MPRPAASVKPTSPQSMGLKGTALAQTQATTIRLKVLKIGALIRVTVRKVWIALAGGYPYQEVWAKIWGSFSRQPCAAERGVTQATVTKDIHRRKGAESPGEVLYFQEADGPKTGPWLRAVIHRDFFGPSTSQWGRRSDSQSPRSRSQKTGEKSRLESAVTWPWRTWLCDNSWECSREGRECRD